MNRWSHLGSSCVPQNASPEVIAGRPIGTRKSKKKELAIASATIPCSQGASLSKNWRMVCISRICGPGGPITGIGTLIWLLGADTSVGISLISAVQRGNNTTQEIAHRDTAPCEMKVVECLAR